MGSPSNEVENKIIEYEKFVDEVLRNDLKKVMKRHEIISKQLADYLNIKSLANSIKEGKLTSSQEEPLKTQCNIGCNFYVQCVVPDPYKIYVDVGMGFYVEYSLDEAIAFIDKKEKVLNEELESLRNQASKIKAHIKLVLEALAQLQNLSTETRKEHINIWD